MKKLIILVVLSCFSNASYAQFNLWHSMVNKCSAVRNSCLEHLKAGCKKSGIYSVSDLNNQATKVYCDQVTGGGGWTNLNYNFGSVSDVVISNNNTRTIGTTTSGTASQSSSEINGAYVSFTVPNTCTGDNNRFAIVRQDVVLKLKATEMKLRGSAQAVTNDVRCGGMYTSAGSPAPFGGVGILISKITRYSTFEDSYVSICDNDNHSGSYGSGKGFGAYQAERDVHWSANLTDIIPVVINSTNYYVGYSMGGTCAAGTVKYRIQSLMVR